MKNFNLVLSLLALGALTSACGNVMTNAGAVSTPGSGLTPVSSGGSYATSSTNGLSASSQCSPSPNVVSSFDNSIQNDYHACNASGVSTNSALFYDEDLTTKSVCVFPAKVVGNQVSVFLLNAYTTGSGRFAMQCGTITPSGLMTNFGSSISFNAAYIVKSADANSMSTCLAYGDVTSCAESLGFSFSYGQFR